MHQPPPDLRLHLFKRLQAYTKDTPKPEAGRRHERPQQKQLQPCHEQTHAECHLHHQPIQHPRERPQDQEVKELPVTQPKSGLHPRTRCAT